MSLVEDAFSFFNTLTPFKNDGGGFEPASPDKLNSPEMCSPFSFVSALEDKDPNPLLQQTQQQIPMQQKMPQEQQVADLLEQYKQQLLLQQQQQQFQQLQQLQQLQQFQQFQQQTPQQQLQQKFQQQLKQQLQQQGFPGNEFFFQPSQTIISNSQTFYPSPFQAAPQIPALAQANALNAGLLSKLVPSPLMTLVSGAGVPKTSQVPSNNVAFPLVAPQSAPAVQQPSAQIQQQVVQQPQNGSNASSPTSSTSQEGVSSPETDNGSASAPKKPVTAASARKDRLKRRRDQKTTKSPKDSGSSEEDKPLADKDNELKRQRRLIKNRESAQASRERKKQYVQNLEDSVNALNGKNTEISQKLVGLEEENKILKQQLMQLTQTKLPAMPIIETEINEDEPDAKKRRINNDNGTCPMSSVQGSLKLPMPKNAAAQSGYLLSLNPFNSNFWSSLLGVNQNAAQAMPNMFQQQPTLSQDQFLNFSAGNVSQPTMNPTADAVNGSQFWSITPQTKGVILFVILFCVAMLFGFPDGKSKNSLVNKVSYGIKQDGKLMDSPRFGDLIKKVGSFQNVRVEKIEPFSSLTEKKAAYKVGRSLKTTTVAAETPFADDIMEHRASNKNVDEPSSSNMSSPATPEMAQEQQQDQLESLKDLLEEFSTLDFQKIVNELQRISSEGRLLTPQDEVMSVKKEPHHPETPETDDEMKQSPEPMKNESSIEILPGFQTAIEFDQDSLHIRIPSALMSGQHAICKIRVNNENISDNLVFMMKNLISTIKLSLPQQSCPLTEERPIQ